MMLAIGTATWEMREQSFTQGMSVAFRFDEYSPTSEDGIIQSSNQKDAIGMLCS